MTRLCFGTNEYGNVSLICKRCSDFISCGEINPKSHKEKKVVMRKAVMEEENEN